ncbi:MAG: sugar phosphate isomerase/epimerase family protein [Actinomycetota bacterium]
MIATTHADGPRIVCSTVSLFSKALHDVFPLLAETGFAGVELMVTKDPDTQDPRRLAELAEDHELGIAAIHAPFLLMTRSVWGAEPVGKIYRAIELAEEVGAPLVVVHPPYRWQARYRDWLTERLPTLAEGTSVRVAVENMFPVRVRGRKLAAFHAIRTLEDLEGFEHVVLDTSHAAVAGLDLFEALRALRGRLAHVHLSNNAGKGWDSHLPVTEGVLPLDRFLDALAAERYSGTISLEMDLRRSLNDPEELRRTLIANREFCAARLPLVA